MKTLQLTEAEIDTLLEAISDTQAELCFDPSDPSKFPEAYKYNNDLDAVADKLIAAKRSGT